MRSAAHFSMTALRWLAGSLGLGGTGIPFDIVILSAVYEVS